MPDNYSRKKIVLSQLPHPSYIDRNIPLAAGYLKSSAYKHGLLGEVDIEILAPELSDYSGCQRIINAICDMNPDVLGFSLYLWNVERTLYVIDRIKKKLPRLKIMVGGPEVTRDSTYILSNPNIDIAVCGEGEITFIEVVRHFLTGKPETSQIHGICYRNNGNVLVNTSRKRLSDINFIPSPYLLGFIDITKYREMMLFTMRGCLLGCTYCSWTARGQLRAFVIDRLRNELILAKETGEDVIVSILDSAFNVSPVFVEFCKMAQEINHDHKLKFNSFVQADIINAETARLLKETNFTGVEVGLQSTNPEVLANVNRSINSTRFLRGVDFLKKENIPVKVDVIIGLPGDSATTFKETMQFMFQHNLEPIIFNLSLGHGAKLSRQAQDFGAKVQTNPPFYVLETRTFSRCDLEKNINQYKQYSADFNKMSNLCFPSLYKNLNSYHYHIDEDIESILETDYPIRGIILNLDAPPNQSARVNKLSEIIGQKVGNNISLLFQGSNENLLGSFWLLERLLTQISCQNPYITWNIFLDTKSDDISKESLEKIRSFIPRTNIFLSHRDELLGENLPGIRRTSINTFALLPCDEKNLKIQISKSNCIRTLMITGEGNFQDQFYKLFQSKGNGYLIDLREGLRVDFIMELMEFIYANDQSGGNIFFKDWVLQRLWEQEFLKITPAKQEPHYALTINDKLDYSLNFLSENELLWDAITKWKLLDSGYSGADIEQIIIDKIAAKYSIADNTNSLCMGEQVDS